MNSDVITCNCAADATRAQSHRRHDPGCVTCCPECTERIYYNTEDRFLQPKLHDDILVSRMDNEGMATSAVVDQLNTSFTACFPAIDFVPAEYRCQFLARKRFFPSDPVKFHNQNSGPVRNSESVHLRKLLGTFPYGLWVRKMADEQIPCKNLLGLIIHKERAFRFHQLFKLRGDWAVSDNRLFGGTDHRVIEGLRGNDIFGRPRHICGAVH